MKLKLHQRNSSDHCIRHSVYLLTDSEPHTYKKTLKLLKDEQIE